MSSYYSDFTLCYGETEALGKPGNEAYSEKQSRSALILDGDIPTIRGRILSFNAMDWPTVRAIAGF